MITTEITKETSTSVTSARPSRLEPQRLSASVAGEAARDVFFAFVGSRLLVVVASLIGAWVLPHGPFHATVAQAQPFGGWPLASVFTHVFSPLIRGDATSYLQIAGQHSYGSWRPLVVYFPGYPVAIMALGGFASAGAATIAGYAVSLASFLGALWLLHRLVTLDFGPSVARATVLLVAFSPWAYFFSAPFTESLFLLLTVGALHAARRQRWALAGLLAAGASCTRNSGALLVVPLLLLYLYGPVRAAWSTLCIRDRLREALRPRRRVRPSVLWLALTPGGLLTYSIYLSQRQGDALAWSHYEADFGRTASFPWNGVYLGLRAAWHAVDGTLLYPLFRVPASLDVAVLALVVGGLVVCWRRLPIAYAAYSTIAVIATLSAVDHKWVSEPLISFPRYVLVLFPLFIALGLVCERRRLTRFVVPASAIGLAVLTALFAGGYPYF